MKTTLLFLFFLQFILQAQQPALIYVEGGTFKMGSNEGEDNEKPVHTVKVNSFWIGKYEVTQREWREVMGNNPSSFGGDNLPVEQVSWEDAIEYCKRLSEMTGRKFRLPTEAEWEYAARGGKESRGYRYSGSNDLDEVAWHEGNSDFETHPVGTRKSNELRICDMSGNVWEWCRDRYGNDYYKKSPKNNPEGPVIGELRVLRGGSWGRGAWVNYLDISCRVTLRDGYFPDYRYDHYGFRVVSTE